MNKSGQKTTSDMTPAENARQILDDFDAATSEQIIGALEEIRSNMKIQLTREYLAGKIDGVRSAGSEEEKKSLCKNLRPYLDWEIQGS